MTTLLVFKSALTVDVFVAISTKTKNGHCVNCRFNLVCIHVAIISVPAVK